ncbi:MAG: aminopeptidase [Solobacterium sp.]|nr:aminopeptidase [Solobacterium sp.]
MKLQTQLKRYARLIIEEGINVKKGQRLVIAIPVELVGFGRMLQETAYEAGAGFVELDYEDEVSAKISYCHADEKRLSTVPESLRMKLMEEQKEGSAFLRIVSSNPDLMKGTDERKIGRIRQARGKALQDLSEYQMKSLGAWCVAAMPNAAWARKVFPKIKNDEQAVEALYEAIFHTVYLDRKGDPVANWKKHQDTIMEHCRIMNEYRFKELYFHNAAGTDLHVPLVDEHIWGGGREFASVTKQWFDPNLPTEEIFTAPHRMKTEGTVVASRPLNLGGTLIENFRFTFHKGKVTAFSAKKGKDALEMLLESDNGARRLGEVALVPFDSNISNLNLLFYNTLFDENAACHLALGASYPTTRTGGDAMREKELRACGMNTSSIHVDFMFGTEDLLCDGITADNRRVPVFRKGNFVF